MYLFFFVSFMVIMGNSRWVGGLENLLEVPLKIVRGSKLGLLGGSCLLLRSLFVSMLVSNLVGLFPYTISIRSHLVFSMRFAFPFWSSLIMSRVVFGRVFTSMAKLVMGGLPLLAGGILCWFEVLRIFLRWITLRVRLRANITIGQIMVRLVRGYQAIRYFCPGSWLIIIIAGFVGCFVLVVEVVMSFLQSYVFCMLLRVYRGDHSL
ncbi:MAG: F0F1 ATP synthase subunit A [Candidatus Thiodiazotropha sp.]